MQFPDVSVLSFVDMLRIWPDYSLFHSVCSKLFLSKVWGQTGSKLYGAKSGADYVDNQRRFRIFNEVRSIPELEVSQGDLNYAKPSSTITRINQTVTCQISLKSYCSLCRYATEGVQFRPGFSLILYLTYFDPHYNVE